MYCMYLNNVICWLMLCYTTLSFNFRFYSYYFSSVHFILVCSHIIWTCTFPFIYTLIGSLSDDPEFAHPGLWLLHFCWSDIWGEALILRGVQTYSFDLLILSIVLTLFFIPHFFYSFLYSLDPYLFYWFIRRIMLSLCKNYMLYCNDFIAFIVDLYNLFGSH